MRNWLFKKNPNMGNIYNWSQGVYNAYFDDLLIKIQKSLKEVQLK